MNKPIFFYYILVGAALSLLFNSCATQSSKINPLHEKKAILLSKKAHSFNDHIMASKGTGWLRIETKKKFIRYKIAWVAAAPNKIRITLLLAGQPVESIISNGKSITFLSHTGKHSKKTILTKDANLRRYINIPVKMSEIITMLLGRINVKPFDTAEYFPADSADSLGPRILLKQNWGSTIQTLSLDQDEKINQLAFSDLKGKSIYEIKILEYKSFKFGDLPIKVVVDDLVNRKLTLTILNFEPNPTIKESLFQLTGSGS